MLTLSLRGLLPLLVPSASALSSAPLACRRVPSLRPLACASSEPSCSGVLYSADPDRPTVRFFTQPGCTLCDVAKEVLARAIQGSSDRKGKKIAHFT